MFLRHCTYVYFLLNYVPYNVEYLPRLFLKEEECQLLQDMIVLNPDWLIQLMKVVLELDPTKQVQQLPGEKVKDLKNDGVADLDVLKYCWEDFVSESTDIEINHLCLMLQAYCLIYPTDVQSNADNSTPNHVATSGDNPIPRYIIPCKLPPELTNIPKWTQKCATFYFDFNEFLPDEIYHRLICLALSEAKTPRRKANRNCYSGKMCIFFNLLNTNWVIEMERLKQRLKIGVIV